MIPFTGSIQKRPIYRFREQTVVAWGSGRRKDRLQRGAGNSVGGGYTTLYIY